MKRIVAFIFVLALSGLVAFAASGEKFDYSGLEKVCFVCSGAENEFDQGSVVQSGSQVYITVTPKETSLARQKIENLDGYVLYFSKNTNLNALKHQFFDFSNKEYKVGDYQIIEGYTKSYGDFREIGGKRYNVQLAITPDEIIIGFPTILTGF